MKAGRAPNPGGFVVVGTGEGVVGVVATVVSGVVGGGTVVGGVEAGDGSVVTAGWRVTLAGAGGGVQPGIFL
jgi:hypothetical protein